MIKKTELHTDILVLGSGPSGFAAAYSAAKNGARVTLVEQCGDIGGISTSGLMSHWTGNCGSPLYHEILRLSAEKNEFEVNNTTLIDPEKLKTLYLEMLCEVGVNIMLYTFAHDAICDGDKVLGATVVNKSGMTDIYAQITIDATGDGDIAARAGAEFILGRESDNKMQPATIMFKVGGVDYERAVFLPSFESTYQTVKGELQALAKQNIPYPAGHILTYRTTLPGVVTCNMTNAVDIDGTNATDLTKATLTCRRQMDDTLLTARKQIVKYLRKFVPGYENCFIISSASLIGVRETRHFKGKYTLNEQDILEAKVFDDYVVKDAYFNFDVHNITGSGLDKTGVQHGFKQNRGYTVPYENLLLCGRNISGTHMAHSNFRAMPICVGIGEAAGVAAALAVKQACRLEDVNSKEIRKIIGI